MALIEVRAVSKVFDLVRALDGVSLAFEAGEIHSVVGENGAGKSTLMSLLSGSTSPTSGEVWFKGTATNFRSPLQARNAGIEVVHQHFMLIPNFTVEENLALAAVSNPTNVCSYPSLAESRQRIAEELGWQIHLHARVSDLPVGTQQRIEIVKALGGAGEVLILDEPTAVLTPVEVTDLFRVLRELKNQNVCVILIAHKLDEVLAVADRVSVLRKGRLVGTVQAVVATSDSIGSE